MRQTLTSISGIARLTVVLAVTITAVLFALTIAQQRAADDRTTAETRHLRAVELAQRVRQSSDDLTMMARLHVTTGEPRYRRYFNEILSVRAGLLGRPRAEETSYWAFVLADRPPTIDRTARISVRRLLQREHFTAQEIDVLNAAINASDFLAVREQRAMDIATRRAAQGDRGTYLKDIGPVYRTLVDHSYFSAKADIVDGLDRFKRLVDQRIDRDAQRLSNRTDDLLAWQQFLLIVSVLTALAILVVVSTLVLRPLRRLTPLTQRMADGDYAVRAPERGVAELAQLGGDFNTMADAVERDIAARRAAEAKAVQADNAKSDFLAKMSHELRTPLVGISGTLDVLAQGDLDSRQRELITIALQSSRAMHDVIGDVLDFSKIEAGALRLSLQPTDVNALVLHTAESFEHAASAAGLVLRATTDQHLAPAHDVDAVRLRQVLSNLVSNAIKYTDDGHVAISARVVAEEGDLQTVAIAVTDTGAGIPADQQGALFEPFAQAEGARPAASGTGLGLAICRELVQVMGGEISLESTVGRGTTVTATIPLRVSQGDPAAAVTEPGSVVTRPLPTRQEALAEGSLVLLVDDHPINRTVLSSQLEAVGFQVDAVEGAADALRALDAVRYGLVLTDIHMPGIDGYDLAREIRRRGSSIPIVAMTASVVIGEKERCVAAGMDDLLGKPASLAAMAKTLRTWLPDLQWPESAGDGVDHAVLAALVGGDPELARSVLDDFRATCRDDLQAIEEELDGGADPAVVRRLAHRLKGAAALVGAQHLAAAALELETAADAREPEGRLRELAGGIRSALGAVPDPSRRSPG